MVSIARLAFLTILRHFFDYFSPRPGQKKKTGALTTHFANDVPSTMIFAFSDMNVVFDQKNTPKPLKFTIVIQFRMRGAGWMPPRGIFGAAKIPRPQW